MRDTTTAVYRGKEYDASLKEDGTITLISDDKNDKNNGFSLYKGLRYIKNVRRNEVDELYDKNYIARYRGFDFWVHDERDNQIWIVAFYNMDYRVCDSLGMKAVDKGVYGKWIDKDEAEIRLEKEKL